MGQSIAVSSIHSIRQDVGVVVETSATVPAATRSAYERRKLRLRCNHAISGCRQASRDSVPYRNGRLAAALNPFGDLPSSAPSRKGVLFATHLRSRCQLGVSTRRRAYAPPKSAS